MSLLNVSLEIKIVELKLNNELQYSKTFNPNFGFTQFTVTKSIGRLIFKLIFPSRFLEFFGYLFLHQGDI